MVDVTIEPRLVSGRSAEIAARPRVARLIGYGLLSLLGCIWIAPFVFMFFTALKQPQELYTSPSFAPPVNPHWDNFAVALEMANFAKYGLNSLVVAFVKVPLGILVSALAAFLFSRYKFRFRGPLFLLFILGTMVPVQVAIIPMFDTLRRLGLLNTHVGLVLVYIAFGVPAQIFLLRGFFNGIPRELDEAAAIDGASRLAIFWRIILPLSKPILASLFILDFVATWNEFSIALVVLQSSQNWTIPLGLQAFQGQFGVQFHLVQAVTIAATIPVLVLYIVFQRAFVSGLTAGAVKGGG